MRVEIEEPQANISDPVGRSVGFLRRHPIVTIAVAALSLRVAVAVLLTKYFSGSLVVDDLTYWEIARDLAEGITWKWDAFWGNLYATTRTFSIPLSVVYEIFGPSQLAGQIFVAVIGTVSVVATYLLGRKALGPLYALFPAAILAFLPSLVIWSSLVLKDAFVWTTLILMALCFANLVEARSRRPLAAWFVAVLTCTFALSYLRAHSLVMACFALFLASWVGVSDHRKLRMALLAIVLVVVPWTRGLGPAGWTLITSAESITEIRDANARGANTAIVDPVQTTRPTLETESIDAFPSKVQPLIVEIRSLEEKRDDLAEEIRSLEEKQDDPTKEAGETKRNKKGKRLKQELKSLDTEIAEDKAVAEAMLAEEYDPTRAVGAKHVVRGLSVMLAEPYPWDDPTSASFKMAQGETTVWYPLLLLALLGLLPALSARAVMLFPLLLGGAALVVYALAEGNVGTAFRHRSEFTWVIALLSGFGIRAIKGWIDSRKLQGQEGSKRTRYQSS